MAQQDELLTMDLQGGYLAMARQDEFLTMDLQGRGFVNGSEE